MKPLLVLLFVIPICTFGQNIEDFGLPMINGNIGVDTFVHMSNTRKEVLFKRAEQFVAVTNFEKPVQVTTKSRLHAVSIIVNKPILYKDLESGKIIGTWWLPLKWGHYNYTYVLFDVRIEVADNSMELSLSNFKVRDILDASRSSTTSAGIGIIGAASTVSSGEVSKEYPLSEYLTEHRLPSKWLINKDNYAETFKRSLKELVINFINTEKNG